MPCGSWPSELTAERVVRDSVSLSEPRVHRGRRYWLEGRPAEAGRQTLVMQQGDAQPCELTLAPYHVRARVHEYGGGAYAVDGDSVYFIDTDGGFYRIADVEAPAPELVVRVAGIRLGGFVVDRGRQRVYCICEDHRIEGREPVTSIVAIDLRQPGQEPSTLVRGEDFYSSLALSPDGRQLAWLSWNHPDMPWDRTRLWLADLDAFEPRCLIDDEESVFQPEWSPDGVLYCASDRDRGWWNLHRWTGETLENITPIEAEFGLPQWVFGMSVYGFLSSEEILASCSREGRWELMRVHLRSGELEAIAMPYSDMKSVRSEDGEAVFLASSPTALPVVLSWRGANEMQVLRNSGELGLQAEEIAIAEAIDYPTADGSIVHAFYYPPTNPRAEPLPGERPPLIVMSHGGPTAANSDAFSVKVQYWTSRGFALLDVNYRGSTGYGRAYRRALNGLWGVADVEDCVHGARYLAAEGRIDPGRTIIRGSSAGGFTTLCALTFHDVFRAGASLYGIGNLESLAKDTHKFEARYLDRLVGPYPAERERYRERSPIHHIDQLSCPVIFLQGMLDRVVPPSQAEAMVTALKEKGIPVAYIRFEQEQHGFRKGESIRRAYESELAFYGRVFGFTPADELPPLDFVGQPAHWGRGDSSR